MWELIGALGSAVGSFLAADEQKDAADKAAAARLDANRQAMNYQNQQFNSALGFQNNQLAQGNQLAQQQQGNLQGLFAPFLAAGNNAATGLNQYGQGGLQAFQQQQALSGALGAQAQQQAISGLENSPIFSALAQQGENAILQNASATGGLRGGNVQAALAQYRPQLLNQQIQQQFQNLGSLSSLGAQSFNPLAQLGAAGVSGQAQGTTDVLRSQLGLSTDISRNVADIYNRNAAAVGDLYGQQGAVNASNALAQGQADANFYNNLGRTVNLYGQQQTADAKFQQLMGNLNPPALTSLSQIPNWFSAYGIQR